MLRIPRPPGTFKLLFAWLVPWRPAFRVRAKNSRLSFFVNWRDLIGRHIAEHGNYEPLLTQWISDYLSTSSQGMFVDVGANLGWHAIHAAEHKSVETVVAFEPDTFNAWLLDCNLSLNDVDNVVISTCALGAQRGLTRLHKHSVHRGRHSVLTDYGYGSRLVPLADLDTALDDLGLTDQSVLIVKIDVEGYEPEVVAGARHTLARADVVVLEYAPSLSRAGGVSVERMLDQLYALGLLPYTLKSQWGAGTVNTQVFEGQIDLIWMRPDKEAGLSVSAANLLQPTDKANLLQIAKILERIEGKAKNIGKPVDGNGAGPLPPA
jgi:FkbM family methyltransferase